MLFAIALLIFPAFMVAAAISDLLTMRIPNWLVLTCAGSFFAVALLAGLPLGAIGVHVLVGLGFLAVTFGMFAAGWIGGGDAKFAAATALWLGTGAALPYLFVTAIAGGVLAIVMVVMRRFALPQGLSEVAWIARLHNRITGIPYGIALAIGGLVVYPQTAIFSLLTA
ncbi:prepilin peptidase [Pelagibacterium halotolerans]|uniref:A24 family peptidase n=1 Tax=Pelagibacterium halotolerans TaxID=531813 RepID=UPI00384DC3AF